MPSRFADGMPTRRDIGARLTALFLLILVIGVPLSNRSPDSLPLSSAQADNAYFDDQSMPAAAEQYGFSGPNIKTA